MSLYLLLHFLVMSFKISMTFKKKKRQTKIQTAEQIAVNNLYRIILLVLPALLCVTAVLYILSNRV